MQHEMTSCLSSFSPGVSDIVSEGEPHRMTVFGQIDPGPRHDSREIA